MANVSELPAPERRRLAQHTLDSLTDRAGHTLTRVRCGCGHHVAAVFDTPAGPVYQAATGARAHGSRDFVDAAHGAHGHGTRFADLLAGDGFVDDALPASCECGPHTLSRVRLQQAVTNHEHKIQLP
ncbi:hypothetical protein ACFYUD_35760 [Nocardia tengchongensis]|uniref:hypothetical protein n=1 Tax=Nocardia tengchongensis TaxID=2055889 RepID=UPI0036A28946